MKLKLTKIEQDKLTNHLLDVAYKEGLVLKMSRYFTNRNPKFASRFTLDEVQSDLNLAIAKILHYAKLSGKLDLHVAKCCLFTQFRNELLRRVGENNCAKRSEGTDHNQVRLDDLKDSHRSLHEVLSRDREQDNAYLELENRDYLKHLTKFISDYDLKFNSDKTERRKLYIKRAFELALADKPWRKTMNQSKERVIVILLAKLGAKFRANWDQGIILEIELPEILKPFKEANHLKSSEPVKTIKNTKPPQYSDSPIKEYKLKTLSSKEIALLNSELAIAG